jgi:hypothetical protein
MAPVGVAGSYWPSNYQITHKLGRNKELPNNYIENGAE